jgi:integration host factor subunit beta
VSKESNLTKNNVEKILNVVLDAMSQALIDGESIDIRGFGTFVVKQCESHIGRNPRTGEKIEASAKRLPFFKVGKNLRERLGK